MTGRSSTISYAAMVNKNFKLDVAKSEESSLVTVPTNQTNNNSKKPAKVESPKEEFPQLNKPEPAQAAAPEPVAEAKPQELNEVNEEPPKQVVLTKEAEEAAEAPAGDDNNGEFIEKKKREKKDNKQRNNNYRSNNNKRPPQSARSAPRLSANTSQKKTNDQPQQAASQAQPSGAQAEAAATETAPAASASQAPRRVSSEVGKTFGEKFDEEKAKYLERFKNVKDYCFNLVKGDLFSANEDVSLAHCVSEDFVMSRGIATEFKKRFGNVDVLLEQKNKNWRLCFPKREQSLSFLFGDEKIQLSQALL